MAEEENEELEVLCISFNQDFSSFAIGTSKGFAIFNLFPLEKNVEKSK
ncbi:MAG: hypothetical protein MJ252_31010 [archaeon]|nr:hypothetical protein [archaeon]